MYGVDPKTIIREMDVWERAELEDFMYDAIFIPEGVIIPGREILNI